MKYQVGCLLNLADNDPTFEDITNAKILAEEKSNANKGHPFAVFDEDYNIIALFAAYEQFITTTAK